MSDRYPEKPLTLAKSPAARLVVTSGVATRGLALATSILNLPVSVPGPGELKLSRTMRTCLLEACRAGITRPVEYRWLDMAARGEMHPDILLAKFSESVRRRLSPEWNHLGRGIECYRRGQWENAINEFRAAFIKMFQNTAKAGRMRRKLGKGDFEGEAKLRCGFFQVYKQSLREHGDIKVAVRDLREMAGLYPEIWDAHLCLAEVLKGCGEFDKATVEYHEAARLGATTGFSVDEPAD